MPDQQETDRPDPAQQEQGEAEHEQGGTEHEQEYNDRDALDFDPDDGLYTGTAVDGGTKIPGPHDQVDDVEPGDEDDEKIADE